VKKKNIYTSLYYLLAVTTEIQTRAEIQARDSAMTSAILSEKGKVIQYSYEQREQKPEYPSYNPISSMIVTQKLPGEWSVTDDSLSQNCGDTTRGRNLMEEVSSNHTSLEEKGFSYNTSFGKWKVYSREKDIIIYRKTNSYFEAFLGVTDSVDGQDSLDVLCWGKRRDKVKVCNVFRIEQRKDLTQLVDSLREAGTDVIKRLLDKA